MKNEVDTEFGYANFLQILPRDVCDKLDVFVAILDQNLVILTQSNHV